MHIQQPLIIKILANLIVKEKPKRYCTDHLYFHASGSIVSTNGVFLFILKDGWKPENNDRECFIRINSPSCLKQRTEKIECSTLGARIENTLCDLKFDLAYLNVYDIIKDIQPSKNVPTNFIRSNSFQKELDKHSELETFWIECEIDQRFLILCHSIPNLIVLQYAFDKELEDVRDTIAYTINTFRNGCRCFNEDKI